MTASLTTTSPLLQFLPLGWAGPARARKAGAAPRSADASAPVWHRLLPVAFRERLAERESRRALAANVARLQEISPHLLDDIGLLDWVGTKPSAPGMPRPAGLSRLRDPQAHRTDASTSTRVRQSTRSVWNAPDHWLC